MEVLNPKVKEGRLENKWNFHVSVELVITRKRHGRKLQVSSCHWFICQIFCRIYNKEEGHSRLWEKRLPIAVEVPLYTECNGRPRKTIIKKFLSNLLSRSIDPQLYPLWSVALFLSIPSSLFLGVFSLHVQLLLFFSLFCCSPLLTCLTNSPEMNRVKRHHYVCVTGLIINSLSTLLLFFNFIFHDLPHGVHIVISGERERSTKDKTQEK